MKFETSPVASIWRICRISSTESSGRSLGIVRGRIKFPCYVGPNITGDSGHSMQPYWITSGQANPTGPFCAGSEKASHMHPATNMFEEGLLFFASRSNTTYGNSSTVQPASCRFLLCIKA